MGQHQGGKEAEDQNKGEGLGHCLYWGFHWKGKAGHGEQPGLDSLNNFSGFGL